MIYRILLFIAIIFILILGGYLALSFSKSETFKSFESDIQKPSPPLGLPPIPWPKDNPFSKEKVDLGRLLYFDKRLSSDMTISCATCHHMRCGYSDCNSIAIGISNSKGTRHSPTIINSAYDSSFFWDGRASSLEDQSKGPLANPKEMTQLKNPHKAHQKCVEHIKKIPGYLPLFEKAFGQEGISIDTISKAIATFERTILSGNSAYDRYNAGDLSALTKEQVDGMKLFKKVSCSNCHAGFNFTDNRFQNIGIGMDVENPDLGRYLITHQEKDWGSFKTPSLRDIEHTAPYMHDGSLQTLEEVVDYYDKGGIKNKNLHPLMKPLNLTDKEKKSLVSFLKSLNGEGWQDIQEPDHFPE